MAAVPQQVLTMPDIRLIALDLDGTLLNSNKELSPRNRKALEMASARGITVVPATGRFYKGIPTVIRDLSFVRYVISINGAQVSDIRTGESIYSTDIPVDEGVAFYEYLDTLPVIYDAYADDWGYITEDMQQRITEYGMLPFQIQMMNQLRSAVPELKAFLREGTHRLQKMQVFVRDPAYRDRLIMEFTERYPQFAVSASLPNNIEVNSRDADKGHALYALADHLGIARTQTMAFGDGRNDLTMLRAAGIGVAMANGHPDVKATADMVAESCDADGVAKVIETLL